MSHNIVKFYIVPHIVVYNFSARKYICRKAFHSRFQKDHLHLLYFSKPDLMQMVFQAPRTESKRNIISLIPSPGTSTAQSYGFFQKPISCFRNHPRKSKLVCYFCSGKKRSRFCAKINLFTGIRKRIVFCPTKIIPGHTQNNTYYPQYDSPVCCFLPVWISIISSVPFYKRLLKWITKRNLLVSHIICPMGTKKEFA